MEPTLIKYSWRQLELLLNNARQLDREYVRIRRSILAKERGFDLEKDLKFDPQLTIFVSNYHRDRRVIARKVNEVKWEMQRRRQLIGVL